MLREELADISHDIWSYWMRRMFTTGVYNTDGTWTMPAELVFHWKRQIDTPYLELTEREQDSDREQADKIMEVIDNNFDYKAMLHDLETSEGLRVTDLSENDIRSVGGLSFQLHHRSLKYK